MFFQPGEGGGPNPNEVRKAARNSPGYVPQRTRGPKVTRSPFHPKGWLGERPDGHPFPDLFVGDLGASLLVRRHHLLQQRDEPVLDQARRPVVALARRIRVAYGLELVVVLEEEIKPLVGHVGLEVGALLLLQRPGLLPPAEGVGFDLLLDRPRGVGQKHGARVVGGGHLAEGALERREELGVDQRGLPLERVLGGHQLVGDVARDPEVRVLVDGTRDEARQEVPPLKRDLEARGEARRGLNRGKGGLADVA
mmetsp:Transcript_47633/g.108063  ORF Transcript_47633/g.108063 Transcript_47633/m.108063 type:complete len:252 (-) Transcript_47633:1485-2240(-)